MSEYEVVKKADGWRIIRTSCDCLNDDHILDIEVEKDRDFGTTLIFNYELCSKDLIDMNFLPDESPIKKFIIRTWGKLKFICKIVFNRPITFEEAFIFRGKEHIDEICDYLKEAAKEVEQER